MIKIKTVSGQEFFVSIDLSLNIKHLKDLIATTRNIESDMRLVFNGKVLKNDEKLEDLNLTESSFIIFVPTKKVIKKEEEPIKSEIESNQINNNPLLNLMNLTPDQIEQKVYDDITKLIYGQTYIYMKNMKSILIRNELLKQFDTAFPGKIDEILNDAEFFDKMLQEGKELIESGQIELKENDGEYNQFEALRNEFGLTDEDFDNIQYLSESFNQPVDYVLQVYLACNKNVENTSNIL
jgi:hypothetical protein